MLDFFILKDGEVGWVEGIGYFSEVEVIRGRRWVFGLEKGGRIC